MFKRSVTSFVIAISILGLSAFSHVSPVSADTAGITCHQENITVHLSDLDPTPYNMAGTLCWQGQLAGKTMQLLIPGFSYGQYYWDFPYQQPAYSYVTSAVQAGYATLDVDRLGTGLSDHPLPELTTLQTESHSIHDVVEALRAGTLEDTSFPKIVLVGHSLGTLVAWGEAAAYHDVDGVIASGWLHTLNPVGVASVVTAVWPVALDPKFADSGLPLGYVTTRPGSRASAFYNTTDADPQVIGLDEVLKQTGTDGELATFATGENPLETLQINVPVLTADGQKDGIFCSLLLPCNSAGNLVNREQAFYNPNACLEGYVLPNSGHDMNLHLNAADWYTAANAWVADRVGSTATTPPTQPCH